MSVPPGNIVSSVVARIANQSATKLTSSGNALTTGKKSDIGVNSFFIASGLRDSATKGNVIVENMGYGSNGVKIGLNSLSSIANTLVGMRSTVSQSSGSETTSNLAALNNILKNNLILLDKQIKNTKFNDVKLLTGDLGRKPVLTGKYNTKPVNVRSVPITTQFQGNGRRSFTDIIINDNANVNFDDKVTLGNVTFTVVSGKPKNENEVQKGVDAFQTTSNLATAIRNHSSEFLKTYDVNVTGNAVNITERTITGNNVGIIAHSPAGGIVPKIPTAQTVAFVLNPADGNTVEIAGEIFTFKTVPAAPNDVQIDIDEIATIDNLLIAINVTNPVTSQLVNDGRLYVDKNGTNLRLVAGSEVSAVTVGGPLDTSLIVATSINSLVFGFAPALNDNVVIGGVTFTFVAVRANPNEVAIGLYPFN